MAFLGTFILSCLVRYYSFAPFQTADDTRRLIASFYPELGRPLPERTYAEDCALYTPGNPNGNFHNFMDKMDVFVVCHALGWFVKVSQVRQVGEVVWWEQGVNSEFPEGRGV